MKKIHKNASNSNLSLNSFQTSGTKSNSSGATSGSSGPSKSALNGSTSGPTSLNGYEASGKSISCNTSLGHSLSYQNEGRQGTSRSGQNSCSNTPHLNPSNNTTPMLNHNFEENEIYSPFLLPQSQHQSSFPSMVPMQLPSSIHHHQSNHHQSNHHLSDYQSMQSMQLVIQQSIQQAIQPFQQQLNQHHQHIPYTPLVSPAITPQINPLFNQLSINNNLSPLDSPATLPYGLDNNQFLLDDFTLLNRNGSSGTESHPYNCRASHDRQQQHQIQQNQYDAHQSMLNHDQSLQNQQDQQHPTPTSFQMDPNPNGPDSCPLTPLTLVPLTPAQLMQFSIAGMDIESHAQNSTVSPSHYQSQSHQNQTQNTSTTTTYPNLSQNQVTNTSCYRKQSQTGKISSVSMESNQTSAPYPSRSQLQNVSEAERNEQPVRKVSHKDAEQKRRDKLKNCFNFVKSVLPLTADDKAPSKVQILKKARSCILDLRHANQQHQDNIEQLLLHIALLEAQILEVGIDIPAQPQLQSSTRVLEEDEWELFDDDQ